MRTRCAPAVRFSPPRRLTAKALHARGGVTWSTACVNSRRPRHRSRPRGWTAPAARRGRSARGTETALCEPRPRLGAAVRRVGVTAERRAGAANSAGTGPAVAVARARYGKEAPQNPNPRAEMLAGNGIRFRRPFRRTGLRTPLVFFAAHGCAHPTCLAASRAHDPRCAVRESIEARSLRRASPIAPAGDTPCESE